MATVLRRTELNECRQCSTFCDRVIAPAACVADECPYLYAYDDPLSGRRFMGCIQQVFATEIDVELFRQAERTRAGFGTVRLAAAPLDRCRFTVEQAYDGHGLEAYRCVNKEFYDWPQPLDLRDRCEP
ncbi:MAG TPA: hypothetical protein VNO82_25830 [Solirubrobacteraceae bacterium]|nr:hypothetical protein [Solirubrobacteraceae bacterium]